MVNFTNHELSLYMMLRLPRYLYALSLSRNKYVTENMNSTNHHTGLIAVLRIRKLLGLNNTVGFVYSLVHWAPEYFAIVPIDTIIKQTVFI